MKDLSDLQAILNRIDGRGYKAYKELKGSYDFRDFRLIVDHVQGDPYAAPSRVRVTLPQAQAGFAPAHYSTPVRRLALEDFLTRAFHRAAGRTAKGHRGIGKSGLIGIDCGGQEVLERTALFVSDREVEARFVMGLPARGRTILGRDALEMFLNELPEIVTRSLYYRSLDEKALKTHLDVVEDQTFIREALDVEGLVAFVADGAVLPRRTGIDDRPLTDHPVTFVSPDSLRRSFTTPNRGTVHGMGIPRGITLIVGGGFHGKSTLLNALNRAVYPHIPGDGREYVVTDPTAVKIRAEDGRSVTGVDISPFIQNLPFGKQTDFFSTPNASGSTSQAANIMEALEMGSRLLLIDEDTSATNFMIRDERMQALVAKEKEPITPFVDKVRQLREEFGVSTLLVMGGSGDYLDCADRVLLMEAYRPADVTDQARAVVQTHASRRRTEGGARFGAIRMRAPLPEGFDPSRGKREVRIDARGVQEILFGREKIELSAVEQLVDISQTRAIGDLIHYYSENHAKSGTSLQEGLARSLRDVHERGLDLLSPYRLGCYAMPRLFEVAAAINRMRSLQIKGSSGTAEGGTREGKK
jgi:predicted ABC-class ATPase